MVKLQAEDGSFLFPFVGAGDATYFEWAEVHVLFTREPTEQEKQAIARRVPPPLQDSIEWQGPQLMAASGQFAHMVIDETYPADPDDTDGHEEEEDEPGRFFFAKTSQVRKFNEDTQEWLAEAHQHCPVLVAYRHEDLESGGTELSPWHDWSVRQVPHLLPHFEHTLADGDRTRSAYMLRGILAMALQADPKLEIPQRFRDWLEPGKKELEALEQGDEQRLAELLGRQETIRPTTLEVLDDGIDEENASQLRVLFAVADLLLRQPSLPDRLTAALAAGAIQATHDKQRAEQGQRAEQVLARIRGLARESRGVGDQIANLGYSRIEESRWREAIALFELIYDVPHLEKTAYNNALYAVMADNNNLPVDEDRHRRFVAAALPHGPQNPSIFYNAACIYYELGEIDQVFEQIRLALDHGYPTPDQIKSEPLFAPIAKDPRFTALFETPKNKATKKKAAKKPAKKKATKKKAAKKPAKKKATKKKATKKKAAKKPAKGKATTERNAERS